MTSRTSASTVILARLAASVAASERSKSRGESHDSSSSAGRGRDGGGRRERLGRGDPDRGQDDRLVRGPLSRPVVVVAGPLPHQLDRVPQRPVADARDHAGQVDLVERERVARRGRVGDRALEEVGAGDPHVVEHDRAGAGEPLPEAVPVVGQLDPGPVGLDQHGPRDAVVEGDRHRQVVGVEAAGGVVPAAADQVLVVADANGLARARPAPSFRSAAARPRRTAARRRPAPAAGASSGSGRGARSRSRRSGCGGCARGWSRPPPARGRTRRTPSAAAASRRRGAAGSRRSSAPAARAAGRRGAAARCPAAARRPPPCRRGRRTRAAR